MPANKGCYHGYLRIIHADATDTLDSTMLLVKHDDVTQIKEAKQTSQNTTYCNKPERDGLVTASINYNDNKFETKSRHEIYTLLI